MTRRTPIVVIAVVVVLAVGEWWWLRTRPIDLAAAAQKECIRAVTRAIPNVRFGGPDGRTFKTGATSFKVTMYATEPVMEWLTCMASYDGRDWTIAPLQREADR